MPLVLHQRRMRGAAEPQPDRGRLCPQLPAGAAKRRRAGQRNTGRCTGGGRRTLSVAGIALPAGRRAACHAARRTRVRGRHRSPPGRARACGERDRRTSPRWRGGMTQEKKSPMNSKIVPLAHGCDAVVIQTLPLFEMMRMRAAPTAARHPVLGVAAPDAAAALRWVNQFPHTHRRLGPEDKEVVSPNNDPVYSNAWLDLSERPVVIESPEMGDRYWTLGLLDAWTNPFAYVGRRTTGNRPQRTLVHGPAWRGLVPADITQTIAAPGDDVWLIGRHLVEDDGEDAARVRETQAQMRLVRPDGRDAAMRGGTWVDGGGAGAPGGGPALSRPRGGVGGGVGGKGGGGGGVGDVASWGRRA